MFTLNCRGKIIVTSVPLVMGVINCTPDSFYTGNRKEDPDDILALASKMINEGADILDIGGQSTRPGSERVSAAEEIKRVIPAIEKILEQHPNAIISIDTYYSTVAERAVAAGASIVNDISSGGMDPEMTAVVGSLKTPFICMHMKGDPSTMQGLAQYEDIVRELLDYFIEKTELFKKAGIHDVIIDPGFGFAKTIDQNFQLLRNMDGLKLLNKPILAGLSRKATVYKTLGITAEQSLNGTTVLNTLVLQHGANILRVHDVKEAKEVVKLFLAVNGNI